MEDQHMTQQVFAEFIHQAPATLSSIFNGRTRPTLNIVDAIKNKFPNISIEWLLYGIGDMYVSHPDDAEAVTRTPESGAEPMLNFGQPEPSTPTMTAVTPTYMQGVRNTHLEIQREEMKTIDKEPRKVTEIRVYYDDQTYETFVPAKK